MHDVIAAEMREVYLSTEIPSFLDETAARLLAEARGEFDRLGLRRSSIVEIDGDTFLFPWAGSVALGTLALALKGSGLAISTRGVILEADRTPADKVVAALRSFDGAPPPDAVYLAMTVGNLIREKYDPYLPRELLAVSFASDRMRPEAVPPLARRLLGEAEPDL
jgi:ATP-dependent Lhr-like helicase